MKKINYDKNTNILSIRFNNKRSVDSDIKGNVVLDYDKNGDIVNLEIMKINLTEFSKVSNFTNRILNQKPEMVYR